MTDNLRARGGGPTATDHLRVYAVPDVADLTAQGLAECTCGVRYPATDGTCPNAATRQHNLAAGFPNAQ